MNLPRNAEYEFLVLSYPETSFLVNRNQFYASIYLEESQQIKSRFSYLDSIMTFEENKVLVFDLDRCLKETFGIQSETSTNLVLLTKAESFSPGNQRVFGKLTAGKEFLSDTLLAFRVGSFAEISRFPIKDFLLFPSRIRGCLEKKGIMACRFASEDDLHYLIDVEMLSFGSILRSARR